MCVQKLEFAAVAVPEIIAGAQNLSPGPMLPFLQNFKRATAFVRMYSVNVNWRSIALPVPEIIAIRVSGELLNLQSREGRVEGVGNGTVRNSDGEFL